MKLLMLASDIGDIRLLKQIPIWENFGFHEIESVYSINRATKLIDAKPDLIICDISQRAEEWLWLLSMKRNQIPSLDIILTGKALKASQFRQILHLEAIDFMDKSASLEEWQECLLLFQKRLQRKKEVEQEIQSGRHWKMNQNTIRQIFWKNLCLNRISTEADQLEEEAIRADVHLDMESTYVLILAAMKNHDEMWSKWGEDLCQASIQNLAADIFKKNGDSSQCMVIYSRVAIILEESELPKMRTHCQELINRCKEELGAEIFCYISEGVYCEKLSEVYEGLFSYSKDDVLRVEPIKVVRKNRMEENRKIIIPKAWGELLYHSDPSDLVDSVRGFLVELAGKELLSEDNFVLFQQDMLQLFFTYMEKKELSTHELYDNSKIYRLYKAALSSVDDMCAWVQACAEHITSGNAAGPDSSSKYVTALIREYVWTHMGSKINMQQLADEVHLSADYMTKVFKKETGMTIQAFVVDRRIFHAAELLQSSDMPISIVAQEVGYDNLSYFIRQFRRKYGVTPKKYQSRHLKKRDSAETMTVSEDEGLH